MAFGLEVVMPIEFQIPSLRVQVKERLDEEQSKQIRKEQFVNIRRKLTPIFVDLEYKQKKTKAFVDRHWHSVIRTLGEKRMEYPNK